MIPLIPIISLVGAVVQVVKAAGDVKNAYDNDKKRQQPSADPLKKMISQAPIRNVSVQDIRIIR